MRYGRLAAACVVAVVAALAWWLARPPAAPRLSPDPPSAVAEPAPAPVVVQAWQPPPAQPIRWVPSNASPTKPKFVSSASSFVKPEDASPPAWKPPPGPRATSEANRESHDVAVKRYRDERQAIYMDPAMWALIEITVRLGEYRTSAVFARADALAAVLLEREIGLQYLISDGLVPQEVVRAQACVLTDIPCDLPDYVSCAAADNLRSLARRTCADPSTAVTPGVNQPSAQILDRLSNQGRKPVGTWED